MFIINKDENKITKITETTFFAHSLREREHLQEWLANNPEAFDEELLIIPSYLGSSDFKLYMKDMNLVPFSWQGSLS